MLENIGKFKALWAKFADRAYRYAYVESHLREAIASQVYFIRESRKLTQTELADLAGTKQPAISRIEKGEASLSIKSLEAIARAFDVALSVRFVPFSEVAEDVVNGRIEAYVPPYSDDRPAALEVEAQSAFAVVYYARSHENSGIRTLSETGTRAPEMLSMAQ